ncbi:hypothetical protein HHK36_021199 [Tetracentron sinense]|uniref:Uncharacterized protein n=1 Tax=Tetracentron sinense TaxID=13715 RepID=A0A835DAF3_TETSI|nr:hypothetical protein HHK36_021199 [Tetracentron sinense]
MNQTALSFLRMVSRCSFNGRKGILYRRGRNRRIMISIIKKRKASGSSAQKKLKKLQSIVPGCKEIDSTETLFLKTADYIFLLQSQAFLHNVRDSYEVHLKGCPVLSRPSQCLESTGENLYQV